jgi:phasin family protein
LKPIFLKQSNGFQMSNIEKFPRDAMEAHDAAMVSANTMAATLQTIATAHVEYTRRTIQDGTDLLTKLTSLQSPDQAVGLQTEFAKKSYQAFVQEMRKISELYVDLLEYACRPFEAFANH